jgi:hypothetical protein
VSSQAKVQNKQLVIDGIPPSTGDIFSCSTGPFAWGANAEANCIVPRLAVAFNRGTLLTSGVTPDPTGPSTFLLENSGLGGGKVERVI